jgi:hypothetical protein
MRTALILSLLACASLSRPIWQLSKTLASDFEGFFSFE